MRSLRLPLVIALLGAAPWLAGCQDAAASNPERDTHMGEIRAAANPWPALPPAPSGAVPTPLSAAAPALVAIPAPPPAPSAPAPGAPAASGAPAGAGSPIHPAGPPHVRPADRPH